MKIIRIAKDVGTPEYSWVYINLPKEIKGLMLDFGKLIDEEDRYEKEADGGLEKEPHITVKYGLKTNDVKDVKDRLKNEKGGSAKVKMSSHFETEEYDVVKMDVESEDLLRIHNRLNELPHEDKYPDYHAHATIAYVKKGKGKKYDETFSIKDSFSFNEVFFGDLNSKDHKIKLK
jgi:2'-5' RNA ligase